MTPLLAAVFTNSPTSSTRTEHRSEAASVLVDVLERGKERGEMDDISIRALKMLGLISLLRKDYGTAEQFLWQGLSSSLIVNGPLHSHTMEIRHRYQLLVETQQESQETLREGAQNPKVPCDALEDPFRYFPQRTAKSLGSKSRLDYSSQEPFAEHKQGWRARGYTLRNLSDTPYGGGPTVRLRSSNHSF